MAKITHPTACSSCPYRWKYLDLLDEKDILTIQSNCMIINFKKGETICKQNSDVTHALYLATGMVKLYIEGKKNLILKLIKSGNYIDIQTLFGDKKYPYTVTAVEDSMVCLINADFFGKTARNNSAFLYELVKTISTSTSYVYAKINDISRKQLRGRMADALIYFSQEIYESNDFTMNITRKELAEFASMSMENAVRVLTEFRKDKIISLTGRHIEILHPEILQKISEIG